MKKMLMLMLILGAASFACAMDLEIRVNGQSGDITLTPSDTASLSIYASEAYAEEQDLYFGLLVSTDTAAVGTIDNLSGVITMPPAPDGSFLDPEMGGTWAQGAGVYGFFGSNTIPQTAGEIGYYLTDVIFHCEGPGDAIIQLWSTLDGESFSMIDEVTIHQIPEPATMCLLSLGGLFIRKFKK